MFIHNSDKIKNLQANKFKKLTAITGYCSTNADDKNSERNVFGILFFFLTQCRVANLVK